MSSPQRSDGPAIAALERAAARASGAIAVPGNGVRLLFDGPEIYPVMHEAIAAATKRIHFENYIFRDDATGQRFADALIERAAAGVKVRVLYDWIGSIGTSRAFWQQMRNAGIEVRSFGRFQFSDPLAIISRDHRKVMVVDGHTAVTGGHCIGDEWAGDAARGRQPWRDSAVALNGPAARVVDQAFGAIWRFAGGDPYDDAVEVGPEVTVGGDHEVRVVATRPGDSRASRTMELLFGIGAERVWITEAYMAGLPRVSQLFQDAARDGVDVRLLVPGASDLPMIRNVTRTGYRNLLISGVRVWEWAGPMLHAKSMSVDGRWLRIGSSNLNPSSLLANWEIDVFVDSERLTDQLDRKFLDDLAHSREVVHRDRGFTLGGLRAPTALVVERPAMEVEASHQPGMMERRRGAIIRAAGLVRGAQVALSGTIGLGLILFALLLVIFPTILALGTAAVAGVAGTILLLGSWLRRRRG
ncbi:MAG TPA: phospholipase D-like domain-containing protein [Gemmatimonadales bacterium]|nr:phospholipase D-like domain-containing protein [Gemmatimonadales bacterium]